MSDRTTTVFAVDDDPSVLKAVSRLMRSAGFVAEVFDSAQAFLDGYRTDVTGCVILDLTMPGLDGLELQRRLLERGGALPIIFLTGQGDIRASVCAMKQGAAEFLTKPAEDEKLLAAVQAATRQCEIAQQKRREVAVVEQRLATLTPREREVLGHLLTGKLNKQIAASLGTVEQTIKVHRGRIMRKMDTPTLVGLVRLVARVRIATDSSIINSVD